MARFMSGARSTWPAQIPICQSVPGEDVRTGRVRAALPAARVKVRRGDIATRSGRQRPCLLVHVGTGMSRGPAAGAGKPLTAFVTISTRGRAESDRSNLALINLAQQYAQGGESYLLRSKGWRRRSTSGS